MAQLSQKEREDLTEMYRGKDLYDPAKDSAQDTPQFETPHMMSDGGYCMAHGGYCMAQGGPVKGPKKVEKVMGEFGSGKLKSSSGDKVKDRDQAIAIALSEAGMSNKKANGGMVGYADGGDVPQDGPIFSFDMPESDKNDFSVAESSSTAKNDGNIDLPKYMAQAAPADNSTDVVPAQAAKAIPAAPIDENEEEDGGGEEAIPSIGTPAAPTSVPASAATPKLTPDQLDDLIASLKPTTGQKIGSGAMQGLATLADSIIQGVGRAGPSSISKNIEEQRQNKQQNLINALKAKYETQFRGQELGQGQERIGQEAQRIANEKAAELSREKETQKARELTERGQNLEAQRAKANLAYEQGKETRTAGAETQKQNVEAAQKVVDAYQKAGVLGQLGLKEAPSSKDYENALSVIRSSGTASGMSTIRIKDSTGQLHDLPASSLAKAKQRDPGLQVVQQ